MSTAQAVDSIFQALSCAGDYDPNSLPVERARSLVRELVRPVAGEEQLFIRAALGRVLSRDVISPMDVPPHDNSAMDGYALRHADLARDGETRMRIAGIAYAGRPFEGEVAPGACVRIMTGAVMPAGLDTVAVQERVKTDGDCAIIPPGQKAGQNRRRAGEDLRAGAPALAAGKLLRPADVGLLASLGVVEVKVKRRLRVAVLSTGDELASLGTPAAPGQIYDSNRYTIDGMLRRLGCEVLDFGVARDRPEDLEAAFTAAADAADAVITSGGVSVGEADFVRELMAKLGEVAFWKIAMKPGRPMAFGRIGNAMLFGLPGNPVAVMITFYVFVRDALLTMMGQHPLPEQPMLRLPCSVALYKNPGRSEFQRGIMYRENGAWKVRPTGGQGSGILRSMSEANCLIVLEHERGSVEPGDEVSVMVMEGVV